MSNEIMGLDVAAELFGMICEELKITADKDETGDGNKRIISALSSGRLEYTDGVFTLKLLSPVQAGNKEIGMLTITEPDGAQLRSMSEVKKSNDDVGKGMSVLGSVTGVGLPVINKLKSRDLMVAIEVIGLFL